MYMYMYMYMYMSMYMYVYMYIYIYICLCTVLYCPVLYCIVMYCMQVCMYDIDDMYTMRATRCHETSCVHNYVWMELATSNMC